MQEAIPRSCCVVAEVGVKIHTATCQTHILILPDLCGTKLPQRRGKKKIKTDTPGSLHHVLRQRLVFQAPLPLSMKRVWIFSHGLSWEGAEAHTDTPVPLYEVLEKGGSSQLILLPVVKQLIVLKQLGQTIASLMAQLKHGRDRNHNIF